MIKERLKDFLRKKRATLLGIGPTSKNCVDATIELANSHKVPLMLVCSRRQIDSSALGGGYVNNWSTEEFSNYVLDRDKLGYVLMARDHGGPWQNTLEVKNKLSLPRAMSSAKQSFEDDIRCNFQIIHIDPSINLFGDLSLDQVLDRIYDLMMFCWTKSKDLAKEIIFEIGAEEQSGAGNSPDEVRYLLSKITRFCNNHHIPTPAFMVIQTGTKVMETKNIGTFNSPFRIKDELPAEIQIPMMVQICNDFDVMLKQHNTDYLSEEALQWHPRFGIHAANVAPEFGVIETKAFAQLLEKKDLNKLKDQFLEISFNSKKWEKWMLPQTNLSDEEKAIVSGHYVFSNETFLEVKAKAQKELGNIDIDDYLKEAVKGSILRYMRCFKLI